MAKEKSKKITLKEVLVPIEEQPYVIPENWCWVRPLSVLEIEYGKGLSMKELAGDGYPVFGANGQIGYYSEYMFKEEMALMSCRGAYSGTMNCSLPYSYVTSNSLIMKDIDGVFTSSKFIYYMYSALNTKKLVSGSAQPQVTVQAFKDFAIPLPPLAEQKRIVEQIESLFSKLDEANEKAQEVIDRIETNIEAILYNAFSGKLTQYWRKENGVDYNWENSTLSKIVSGLKYGSSEKSDYNNNGTPVLRIPNIGEGVIDFSDLKYMQGELENSSHEVFENDILIIRSNGSRDLVGKCAIVPALERRFAYASFLIRIKTSDKVLPNYLVRYINSLMARGQLFAKAKSSSGIHNINSKELGSIRIDVPTIEEQTEILKIIDPLIKKELDVKDITSNMIENIAELKKSILAKAFRGELGTNVSLEESSIELLKKTIEEG